MSELTVEDINLLIEAVRVASQLPQYMNDPKTSLRLGWILGTLKREIMEQQITNN